MPKSSHPSMTSKNAPRRSNTQCELYYKTERSIPRLLSSKTREDFDCLKADPLSGEINYTIQAKSLIKDVLQPGETGRLSAD